MATLVHDLGQYVNEVAGLDVAPQPRRTEGLPAYLRQRYDLYRLRIGADDAVGIVVKGPEDFTPAAFEKHLRQLPADVQRRYVLVARNLPAYVRHRLVERRIPFVVPGIQMNWPELGLVARMRVGRAPAPDTVDKVSPATQALAVAHFAQRLPGELAAGEAAHLLGYTPMTMTRAFDELEGAGLAETARRGHERQLRFVKRGKELWELAKPRLRDPVRKTLLVHTKDVAADRLPLAGETALAAMSMLVAPVVPVYAVGPAGRATLRDRGIEQVPLEDVGVCRLQLWTYEPGIAERDGRVDRFSLALSLEQIDYERVASAVEEMLETVQW